MFWSCRLYRMIFAGLSLLVGLSMSTVFAAAPVGEPSSVLKRADSIKTSDHVQFMQLMQLLERDAGKLSSKDTLYLRYLEAWQTAYSGNYAAATSQLRTVFDGPGDITLRSRAGATLINILGIGQRYEEAFELLNQLLDRLPMLTDTNARVQIMGEAALLYIEAGQYDLAESYADKLLAESPTGQGACKGRYLNLKARYRSGRLRTIDQQFHDGVATCARMNESIFANDLRADIASFYIQHDRAADAIELLQKNYADVRRDQYQSLISLFDAVLAKAYWKVGNVALAERFAHDAINSSIKNEYTESLTTAYELLYRIKLQQRDFAAALSWHEKYMAADKAYLNDISTKALAYQVVKQQVQAKKLEVETLGKQNQILQLQQALDRKASETSRLYIALLLSVLVFIGLWAYRIKLSQLRFMRLARHDGLTDIFNRQHFLNEAELQLQYCRRASRDACLVLIDLDHFKAINDTHGHAVGDRVLQRAVDACKAHLRSTDVFGRLGGEEFGILLPECSLEQVLARADQLRAAVASAASDGDELGIQISASFGVACSIRSGYELHVLLVHADEALYRAKREGRNRVRVSDDGAEACHSAEVVSIERV
jgi:diguanylate cyclase (GGDEF)-like protein